jgi:hypothetical protein
MCLLALFYRMVEDAAVVVGANREEFFDRPGEPPQLLPGSPQVVAGVDPRAGGTWLGVNEHGLLAAVTNRRKQSLPPEPRSRGLLTRDVLRCSSSAEAVQLVVTALETGNYAGCNILVADAERAVVIHGGDWLRVQPLPPGLHLLTNSDVNARQDQRLAYASWWLGQHRYQVSGDCLDALRQLCAQTGDNGPAICLRGPDRGTVSSTLIALRRPLARSTYLHAQGAPDQAPYADFSHLFKAMAPVAEQKS